MGAAAGDLGAPMGARVAQCFRQGTATAGHHWGHQRGLRMGDTFSFLVCSPHRREHTLPWGTMCPLSHGAEPERGTGAAVPLPALPIPLPDSFAG